MRAVTAIAIAALIVAAGGAGAHGGGGTPELLLSGDFGLYTIRVDGTGLHHIPHTRPGDGSGMWSPDGTRIAFNENHHGAGTDICVIRVDGTGRRCIAHVSPDRGYPTWSPDGRRLTFDSAPDGMLGSPPDIYVIGVDGSHLRRVTRTEAWDEYPTWMHDGRILFDSGDYDVPQNVYALNPSTGRLTQLTNDTKDAWAADISPDGKRIVYTRGLEQLDLYVAPVTSLGPPQRLTTSRAADNDARWSPDGTQIAFDTGRWGNDEVVLVDPETLEETRLTRSPRGNLCCPSWR